MKIEIRPTIIDYFVCEYCGGEYTRKTEAEMCECECIKKIILKNCTYKWFCEVNVSEINEEYVLEIVKR